MLVERAVPSEQAGLLDDLDPLRRFDLVYPGIAHELEGLLLAGTVEAADGLLSLAERELGPRLPGLPWHALVLVRSV